MIPIIGRRIVTTEKKTLQDGNYTTAHNNVGFQLSRLAHTDRVEIAFGHGGLARRFHPESQYAKADDLRELAVLFNEIADLMDGK